jgi:hypothetical protein
MLGFIWWCLVLGAGYQALRAWGAPTGLATVLGLYAVSAIYMALPLVGGVFHLGSLLTAAGAVAIGARAEDQLQKRLAG